MVNMVVKQRMGWHNIARWEWRDVNIGWRGWMRVEREEVGKFGRWVLKRCGRRRG